MRIISGAFKGRRITAPKKLPVRPTTDMAKEGLFNILNNRFYFDEISVLDLYSGTGNISYEFASRGVSEITAVDAHFGCVQFIEKTAREFKMSISPLKSKVIPFLERYGLNADIIFADPPYNMDLAEFEKMAEIVIERDLLKPDGLLIIEHAKQMNLSHVPHFHEQRKYGGSAFSFFKKTN